MSKYAGLSRLKKGTFFYEDPDVYAAGMFLELLRRVAPRWWKQRIDQWPDKIIMMALATEEEMKRELNRDEE